MVTPSGLVVLTDRRSAAGPLESVVEQAVRGGAGWVVLRERDLGYAQRRALADRLRTVLPPGRLIVAGPDPLGGDAVHLAARDPLPPPGTRLVGRSCHSPAEIRQVSSEDYVTLSPVFATASKPGYGPALTPSGAGLLSAGMRWLALGGITSAAAARACVAAGAAGVAVMGAIMAAADPGALAAELASACRADGTAHPTSGSPGGYPPAGCPAGLPLAGLP